jgi:hypothetical protein
VTINRAIHSLKDPAKLTPYEEKLVALRKKGLTFKQMSEALDGSSTAQSITARYQIIKQKLELLEYEKGSRKSA